MNRPGCEETPKVPLGVSIHYFKKWSAQGVKHPLGSSHRAVQNASLAWGWLRMVRPYSSTLGQPSQAVFLPCMWGQLHAIYLCLQMKTILHYNDSQFEKQFVAKQNMDSNDSDCPTRPFLTREFRLRCRKRNTILISFFLRRERLSHGF